MTGLPQRGPWPSDERGADQPRREWLVTNGLGGYAAGPVGGGLTRRYQGLLVAALPPPVGRLVCVSSMRANLVLGGQLIPLDRRPATGEPAVRSTFTLDGGLPVWRYEIEDVVVEKRIVMPHRRNTTCILFSVVGGHTPVSFECYVLLDIRPHDAVQSDVIGATRVNQTLLEIPARGQVPIVRIVAHGGNVDYDLARQNDTSIDMEEERDRGYPHLAMVTTTGPVRLSPDADGIAALTLTTEAIGETTSAAEVWRAERDRRLDLVRKAGALPDAFAVELVLAADQFVIVPVGHEPDRTAATENGPESRSRSVIAGYHWFTDWGRDTMISLEGLTLATGRAPEAREILRMFARHVHQGLIPNLFPEGGRKGLYHTADATLWYFHAIDRYVTSTGDRLLLDELLPLLVNIVAHHRAGTLFGIGVDPEDGLLRQGAEGYQLTWMDAKVGDWVVTPRRGKAVEINALWHNALCLMADWHEPRGAEEALRYREDATRVRESFNRRFWNPDTGWLFDIVDGESGDDPACRPNQLMAISLRYAALDSAHWDAVLSAVRERLLTPVGLRTLSADHSDYRAKYFGDLRARDAAYHQGTVWPWLIGPYVDALLKVAPDDVNAAHAVLAAFDAHLDDACVGSISEIFDASPPHVPRGCVAQAWSVAEVLRTWLATSTAASATP